MDFNIRLRNGQLLNGIIVSPGDNSRGVVIMVHGLGEHIHRYDYWAQKFKDSGFGFTGLDLPGHGKSDGKRGYIKSFALTDEMIDILINTCKKTFPGIPVYLYGHSLGGEIVLDYLIRKKPRIKGAIVTSPWIRLSFEPPRAKIVLASVMNKILPSLVQPSGLVVEHVSHDLEVVKKYKEDPLNHDKISVSLFHSAMAAATNILNHASEINIKTLIIHGSDDHITSPEGSREIASKNPLIELKIWEGGYHELHNELFRDKVFDYITDWIK